MIDYYYLILRGWHAFRFDCEGKHYFLYNASTKTVVNKYSILFNEPDTFKFKDEQPVPGLYVVPLTELPPDLLDKVLNYEKELCEQF